MNAPALVHLATSALAACLFALPSHAQFVVKEFAQNPVPLGGTASFVLTDATGNGFQLPDGCGGVTVHQGSQDGPIVPFDFGCGAVIVPVDPGGTWTVSRAMVDLAGNPLPAGDYWWRSLVYDGTFQAQIEWHCLRVQGAGPTLSLTTAPKVGDVSTLSITGGSGGAFYFVGLSRTMNDPISIPGPFAPSTLDLCLSADVLLDISLNDPASVMTGSFGLLDASGAASGSLNVPPFASLSMRPLQLQAVLVDGSGNWTTTNGLSTWIRP